MRPVGLFQRKDSRYWWYYIELDGRKISGSTGTEDKRLAHRIYLERRHQLIEGKTFPSSRSKQMRFDAMCALYMEMHAKVNKRSWRDDEIIVGKLKRHFGEAVLAAITAQGVEEYKAGRLSSVKKATINRELTVLKGIFSKAVLWGYATLNPVKQVRLYREELKPVRILTADERRKLFESSPGFLKPIILVALKTGMRKGEILNLRWRDVDLAHHNIHVRGTKSGKMRVLPMVMEVAEALRALLVRTTSEYVFDLNGKRHKDFGAVRSSFAAAVRHAKLDGLTFHDLRHNFATELVQKGADLRTVQEYLGHSTLLMVQRYAHVTEGIRRSTIQLLGRENALDSPTISLRSGVEASEDLSNKLESTSIGWVAERSKATVCKAIPAFSASPLLPRLPPRRISFPTENPSDLLPDVLPSVANRCQVLPKTAHFSAHWVFTPQIASVILLVV